MDQTLNSTPAQTVKPIRTLNLYKGHGDRENTFPVYRKHRYDIPMKCSLHCGYEKEGDGIYWAMQHATMLSASYSDAQRAETARMTNANALQDGELVMIEGTLYRTRILGDYSNAAIFDKVEA